MNNRPDWVGIPLQGILQVLQTKEESTTVEVEKESTETERQPRKKTKGTEKKAGK
ncbi:hypothetical protein ACFLUL_03320 [Chloroflexota bacterium]